MTDHDSAEPTLGALVNQLTTQVPEFVWLRHGLRPNDRKRENTTRTRSLLFMTMAIAAATGNNATTVTVPENGYTSLNIPLVASRGGALSTKSTHPWTFHQVNKILNHAEINVHITNPYLSITKGELLRQAAALCWRICVWMPLPPRM